MFLFNLFAGILLVLPLRLKIWLKMRKFQTHRWSLPLRTLTVVTVVENEIIWKIRYKFSSFMKVQKNINNFNKLHICSKYTHSDKICCHSILFRAYSQTVIRVSGFRPRFRVKIVWVKLSGRLIIRKMNRCKKNWRLKTLIKYGYVTNKWKNFWNLCWWFLMFYVWLSKKKISSFLGLPRVSVSRDLK